MTPLAFREFSYWMLRYRRTWRGSVMMSVANPLLFLVAMGAGLGTLVHPTGSIDGVSYLSFVAPGLLAAAAMQLAFVESSRDVFNAARPQGSYRSATAGPLDPLDVLYGHLLYIAFRLALSAAAFAAVLPLFDGFRTARVLLLVPSALLTGLAFACPMAAFAVSTAEAGRLTSFFRFVMMPLYMFSGTFFPVGQLPLPLRAVVWATPLWHGVELCRGALLGSLSPGPAAVHIGYLAGCAAVFLVVARRAFRRRLHG